MSTTPNYNWPLIEPTDFVTNLPADLETLADAIDADLAGLLGGTTGQVLTKDSNSDHDFSWATLAANAGLIKQIVTASTNTSASSTSGTYADTNLTATITPTSASNKILIFTHQNCFKDSGGTNCSMFTRLVRGATQLEEIAAGFLGTTNTNESSAYVSHVYYDNPATTSATTYKTQFYRSGTGTVRTQWVGRSSIVLLEIAE
jgi:hypothetical protein